MNNDIAQKNPLQTLANSLVLQHFRLLESWYNIQDRWTAAIAAAEITINEKIVTVAHHREVYGKGLEMVPEGSTELKIIFRKWCNDHIQELEDLRVLVRKKSASQVKVIVT
jgi:hypothetical protein